ILFLSRAALSDAVECVAATLDILRVYARGELLCVVIVPGSSTTLETEASRYQTQTRLIFISEETQLKFLASASINSALMRFITERLPPSTLVPYQFGGAVSGNRFFGREAEIDRVLRKPTANFAITGIRRIGKTSLLKEVRERLVSASGEKRSLPW